MGKKMSFQLGVIIVVMFFLSFIIITISNYFLTYKQTYQSAGIEAYGCANITTGLINLDDMELVLGGDDSKVPSLQKAIDWTTGHKHIFESQYIISLEGMIVVPDSNLQEQGFEMGDEFYLNESVIKEIEETRMPAYSEIYTFGGMKRLTGYAPIFKDHDPSKEIIALSAIDFDGNIVKERTMNSVLGSSLIGFSLLFFASIITIILISRRIKPIISLKEYAKRIASGDLSNIELKIEKKDEIGDLAITLNEMATYIRELISQIKNNAEQVTQSTQLLNESTNDTTNATKHIAETAQSLAISVEQQVNHINTSNKVVEQMVGDVNNIESNIKVMSDKTMETVGNATQGSEIVSTATKQMNSIYQTVDELSVLITTLEERSQDINKFTEVITDISNQTNLLSLNAAIEASRAGEHGKGFAVVAEEVRKLAEESTSSAQQISTLITTIQDETKAASKAMAITTIEVRNGIDKVDDAGMYFKQIKKSIDQISVQTLDVMSAVEQITNGTNYISESMVEMSKASEMTAMGSQQSHTSTEEQQSSIEDMSKMISNLLQMAEVSSESIKKFKLDKI